MRDLRKGWAKVAWIGLGSCPSHGPLHHGGESRPPLRSGEGEDMFRRRLQEKLASNQSMDCAVGTQGRKLSDPSIEAIQRDGRFSYIFSSRKCRLLTSSANHQINGQREIKIQASDHGVLPRRQETDSTSMRIGLSGRFHLQLRHHVCKLSNTLLSHGSRRRTSLGHIRRCGLLLDAGNTRPLPLRNAALLQRATILRQASVHAAIDR